MLRLFRKSTARRNLSGSVGSPQSFSPVRVLRLREQGIGIENLVLALIISPDEPHQLIFRFAHLLRRSAQQISIRPCRRNP